MPTFVIASEAKQSIAAKYPMPSFRGDAKHRTRNLEIPGLVLTHHPGMTESPLFAMTISGNQSSAGPQYRRPVADHLRLPRQRDRRRHQDYQRLGAEDCDRKIKACLGAIKPADQRAECG